ncbi:2-dehydro-3-deoxygalactonokinase [Tropicimonas sp. IMCC34043]|uniref:2-dehydro-3-deoxygalactonokinase n=1 Tax=Tropicimonas sp. IMCC34043 TaxID=2248760 RepID=UPI000E23CFB6|nr:2-dehydro-3-deoxygalactonokinase [Tropicimonas sp. IMCC34043]
MTDPSRIAAWQQEDRITAWGIDGDGRVLWQQSLPLAESASAEAAIVALGQIATARGQTDAEAVVCGLIPPGPRAADWLRAVPCPPLPGSLPAPNERAMGLRVVAVPGLSQTNPPDLLCGGETAVAGYLALHSDFDGVLCLTGANSAWIHVSAGEVVSFRSFLTGDLLRALADSVDAAAKVEPGSPEAQALRQAAGDSLAHPERLAARLAQIRAELRVTGLHPDIAAARRAGLLIGAELAAARPWWLGQAVTVIGTDPSRGQYLEALAGLGVTATLAELPAMIVAGLGVARARTATDAA